MSADSRWGFGLIGANIDLEETAKSLSIPISRTIEFEHSDESVDRMFSRYARAQETYTNVFAGGGDFDDDIRSNNHLTITCTRTTKSGARSSLCFLLPVM